MTADAVIGLDLDNTLVAYDDLFHALAVERRLIAVETPRHKRQIRDAVREHPGGEQRWRVLQSLAYGARMRDAVLSDGVEPFLLECRRRRLPVHIVSHRTERAAMDEGTDLRDAALAWMRDRRFFEADGLGIEPANVWFERTRREKIERIHRLGCTHFVDDLEEVFLESDFSSRIVKILYAPDRSAAAPGAGVQVAISWNAVREVIFGCR